MQYREYGSTGVLLSVVGFGGICVKGESAAEAKRMVETARRRGVNYFDVAPQYGNAEVMLGPALEPHRKEVFLACKTLRREATEAREDFSRSLERLRTDYLDLYQLHGIETEEDVDRLLRPGGTVELLHELKERGLVRFVGFSAHNEEAALRLLRSYSFDSILFPVNWVTWYSGRIGERIVAEAQKLGIAVLALKALALRRLHEEEEKQWHKSWYKPVETPEQAELGLRFTLSRPVTAAVSPGHEELLWWACDAADTFTPLSAEEEETIAEEARRMAPLFSREITSIR
jgi:aryl-alcohol dehydrogenase-like predicted oxidoreductase